MIIPSVPIAYIRTTKTFTMENLPTLLVACVVQIDLQLLLKSLLTKENQTSSKVGLSTPKSKTGFLKNIANHTD